ncbi:MAG: hypothetical protein GX800_05540, partial [Clostridiaceae bacterium]|nr:hypothetical protein [Clostridiaceae bacterium]
VTVRVLTLDESKDPDDYIQKHGVGAFNRLIKDSKLQIEYKISKLQEKYNLDNIEEKVKYVNELASEFAKIASPVERELYVSKIAEQTGVSAESIISEIQRLHAVNARKSTIERFKLTPSVGAIKSRDPKKENVLRAQQQLLNLMCADKSLFSLVSKELTSDDFEEGVLRNLFNDLSTAYQKGKQPEAKIIVSQAHNASEVAQILHVDPNISDKPLAATELIRLIVKENQMEKMLRTAASDDVTSEQKLLQLKQILKKGGREK